MTSYDMSITLSIHSECGFLVDKMVIERPIKANDELLIKRIVKRINTAFEKAGEDCDYDMLAAIEEIQNTDFPFPDEVEE